MKDNKRPHANNLCGAKTRAGTPCKNKAMPNGRCRMHGGKSPGVKGNKNAVTTGERESIIFDFLDEEEKDLLNQIDLDKINQINNDIKLIDIRLRRMMKRIQLLQINGDESNLFQIQNIEDAITRVQSQKLRLIESKHKLEIDLNIIDETRKAQLEQIKVKTEKLKGVSSDIEDMSDLRRLLLNEGD